MKREIHIHYGPTNSGKTMTSIKRLLESKSGVYCSPLKMLAYEVQTKLENEGVQCSLVTGEER